MITTGISIDILLVIMLRHLQRGNHDHTSDLLYLCRGKREKRREVKERKRSPFFAFPTTEIK